jgi:hypothetical protein
MTLGTRGKQILAVGLSVVASLGLAIGLVIVTGSAGTGPAAAGPTVAGSASATPASPSTPASTAPASTAPASTAPATTAPAISSGDAPAGFWFGTDSNEVTTPGPAPYREPGIGGGYGGYIGMIGNWAAWMGCGGKVVWSVTDSDSASTNYASYHVGIGVGGYWFMAGPGVDPNYDGTTAEAYAWGQAQAARALSDLPHEPTTVNYPVVFMDIELPGNAPSYTPASDNGWTSVYTSACSGQVKQQGIPATVNRADVDGFTAYLTSHSSYKAGVYSAPSIWTTIFGTDPATASIPDTYEWTYTGLTSSLAHLPDGWCLSGTSTCAEFFGGQTSSSPYALMWQWSGGGGTYNGYGDFDQIDAARTP